MGMTVSSTIGFFPRASRLVGVLGLLTACAGCGSSRRPPDIVLILIDTLRADHLGVYGYPRDVSTTIDAFARQNLTFEYALAAAPWTPPSVASMFTGFYPSAHGVHTHVYERRRKTATAAPLRGEVLSEDLDTLAEVLRRDGYRTTAVTTNAWISERLGFAQGFDTFEVHDYSPAEVVNQRAVAHLDELRSSDAPFFLFLHYMDPHEPYAAPRDFGHYYRGTPPGLEPGVEHASLVNQYDEEIRYVDAQLGSLFAYLRQIEQYDDTVVLLVGDHGEQFYERGQRGHGIRVHNEELHVPMILKAPGLSGSVPVTVSLVDVYPTLLGLAGISTPPSTQGVSLIDGLAAREAAGVMSEMTRKRNEKAFVDAEGRKLILTFDADETDLVGPEDQVQADLYDRRLDYAEAEPIDDPVAVEELTARFYDTYRASLDKRRTIATSQVEIDAATLEQLEALGYLLDGGD